MATIKPTVKHQIGLTLFTSAYLVTVLFTDVSLTGYWTDAIFSALLVSITLKIVFKHKVKANWLSRSLRTLAVLNSIVVFGLIAQDLINPLAWNKLSTRSFYFQSVDERLFNAYFTPVGAYAGGEGNFWISESPAYLPIIEIEKFYHRAILWDFNASEFDGQALNQGEIVKAYINEEVIEKGN